MAQKMKTFWSRFRHLFGLEKSDEYVTEYLNEANMRSGVFMAAIIVILEGWLLIRQSVKYVFPTLLNPENKLSFFRIVFSNTSNFWLLLSLGVAMMIYCLQYLGTKKSKGKMITTIVFASVSLVFCALMPFEFKYGAIKFTSDINTVKAWLKIVFYIAIILFNISVIIASIYHYKGGRNGAITSVVVISLFALICLMFGVMVSYSDFVSSSKFADGTFQRKQIICFLVMSVYVGCLLIWKPLISLGVLGVIFLGFYFALDSVYNLGGRQLPEGDVINYITFFVSLVAICISIYNQRMSEAQKDKSLEILATKDKLTGLYSFEYFLQLAEEEKDNHPEIEFAFVFANIRGFKIYNDQKGFTKGNEFLKEVGHILKKTFPGSLVARPSDDHFVVFAKNVSLAEHVDEANHLIESLDGDVRPNIVAGGYVLTEDEHAMHASVDKARYACSFLTKKGAIGAFIQYTTKMHDDYIMGQYVVHHIDEAIEKGYIQAYYQPVVWSNTRKLCGVEALARWIDPRYGFMNPATFIPILESAKAVYKLDIAMLKIVCKTLRDCIDNKLYPLPTSINFSRADFSQLDVVKVIDDTVNEYDLPHNLIHVEITESALTDDEGVLHEAVNRLHELGYSLWLDDFGSGYSSFNVLKDYDFDVLKLDMKFLSGFDTNKKSKALISAVVKVANGIGMRTLCEGVETSEEAEFLTSVACGRLQGFLYGKPLSFDELKNRVEAGEYTLAEDITEL